MQLGFTCSTFAAPQTHVWIGCHAAGIYLQHILSTTDARLDCCPLDISFVQRIVVSIYQLAGVHYVAQTVCCRAGAS